MNFNSTILSERNGKMLLEYHSEAERSFYFPPPIALEDTNSTYKFLYKRGVDTKFHGKPKTKQEVWSRNFNLLSQEFDQGTSLVDLMNKIIVKYLGSCIPIILYDEYVEQGEAFILQKLFQQFPTTFMHGKVDKNYNLMNKIILQPADSKCRSYILFVSDALQTKKIIGPQIDNKVIVIPRSTQWKLQEFLSSPLSRGYISS